MNFFFSFLTVYDTNFHSYPYFSEHSAEFFESSLRSIFPPVLGIVLNYAPYSMYLLITTDAKFQISSD
jgi:hypothetical protein